MSKEKLRLKPEIKPISDQEFSKSMREDTGKPSRIDQEREKILQQDTKRTEELNKQPVATSQMEDGPVLEQENKQESNEDTVSLDNAKLITTEANPDSNYLRVTDLPSNFIFYDFDSFHIRPFQIRELSKIFRSAYEENVTHLIDAIDATTDINVRMLTLGDFYFLMYMQRINSYPKSPYTISWVSRYGNDNKFQVNHTNIQLKYLEDKDKLQEYIDIGLTIPRVSDMELVETENLNQEDKFLYEHAQYMPGATIEEKLANLDKYQDLSVISDINKFKQITDHGVTESVEVVDAKFEPTSAVAFLREQVKQMKESLNKEDPNRSIMNRIKEYETEIAEIEAKVIANETPQPRKENIQLTVGVYNFFPTD